MNLSPGDSSGRANGAPAVEVRDLTKRYRPGGVEALRGISFEVARGEIFGLLGRNGAGKSTTVRILTTLLRPTNGTARVLGLDVIAQPGGVRRGIGVALQDAALDELMTGREHLVLAARLTGAGARAAADRAAQLLELFGLSAAADRLAGRYSGGMRRRLDVAMALVRSPEVLFLDEPTTGLDPQSRRALWELIREQRRRGTTVFLTTQHLAEADDLADRVAIVHDGRLAALGTPDELKGRFGATTVGVRARDPHVLARVRALAPAEAQCSEAGGELVVTVAGGDAAVLDLVGRLTAAGVALDRLAVLPPNLEDVFVHLTGAEIESGPGGGGDGSLAAVRRGMGVAVGNGR